MTKTVLFVLVLSGAIQRHEPAASTRAMIQLLEELHAASVPGENLYDNERRARELEARMQEAEARGEASPVDVRARHAVELLHSGESERAALRFAEILEESAELGSSRLRELLRSFLAVAHLRIGEQENCLALRGASSCLVPIRAGGVHHLERGSRAAVDAYLSILKEQPDKLGERWLLNLAYMTLGEYPDGVPDRWRIPEGVFASAADIGRFVDRAPELGVDVLGLAGGVVAEDFDRDGDIDLMTSSWGLRDPLRYFANDGGGSFTERTDEARLTGLGGGLNLVQADYDNDGFVDVLVLRGAWLDHMGRHPNSLLRNRGDGTFEDVTVDAGIASRHPTQTAAWGDYDNDGAVDLFIGNESLGDEVHPSELYRNNGDGTFRNEGPDGSMGYVKAVVWGDVDNDGRLDLYVSRLGLPNMLVANEGPGPNGKWRFRETSANASVREPVVSFPAWFWDYDNDGFQDLFVSGYGASSDPESFGNAGSSVGEDAAHVAADYLGIPTPAETPRLYRNRGDGTFENVTSLVGLDTVLYTMGSNFGDLDNDGFLDFYAGTGSPDFRALVPNRMFRNDAGRRFQDVTTSGGFGHIQKGHGVAFADFDGDGDQDVYAVMGGSFSGDAYPNVLFENPGNDHGWVTLHLVGREANRDGIGARVAVTVEEADALRTIHVTGGSGGSFGASSLQQEVGLGAAVRIVEVAVRWPGSGRVDRHGDVPTRARIVLIEGASAPLHLSGRGESGRRR